MTSVKKNGENEEARTEGETVKGGDALLACFLEDQGKPEATHYLWTKSVAVFSIPTITCLQGR